MTHTVYLGLGSNLNDREDNICRAIELIDRQVGRVLRRSSLIESEPWGFESAHRFLNAVVCCETTLSPRQLLAATQQIERTLGKRKAHATQRHRTAGPGQQSPESTAAYHDRPIDIDILLFDQLTVDEPDLKIPHPLMQQRDFVMIPLREIASDTDLQQL